jgi:hypothetical protein
MEWSSIGAFECACVSKRRCSSIYSLRYIQPQKWRELHPFHSERREKTCKTFFSLKNYYSVLCTICMRRIFEPKRDEVRREWRRLHNKEPCDLYSSPNTIRVFKPRILRWEGHVARMGESRGACKVLVGKPEGRRPFERPRHRWAIMLKWVLEKWDEGGHGLDRSGS